MILRALRRRRRLRQIDVAQAAGVSQSTQSRAESGHFDRLSLRVLRRIFAAVDAEFLGEARWRGGALDRLIDQRHAEVSSAVVTWLIREGWQAHPEVTYSRYGERGSMDVVGLRPENRAALMVEVKTEIASSEEMNRRFDAKVRLLSDVCHERFGWRPSTIGGVIVLLDSSTNRDRATRLGALLDTSLPTRGRDVIGWLRRPHGRMRGLWFVRVMPPGNDKQHPAGPQRVRRPRSRPC